MNALIEAALNRSRTVLLTLAVIIIAGSVAYVTIPKEAAPDVPIPIIYVSITHEGISPEDAERLLIRPMEKELQAIEGLKEMRSTATEGFASIVLEFTAGFDSDQALQDVREKVDLAKVELPDETEEPSVNEINVALFPVLVVTLSGNVPERTLVTLARDLQDKLEALEEVLEVDIAGDREEMVEVLIDPVVLDSYQLSYEDLIRFVQRNNRLVAAGALDTGEGRFPVKIPGLLEEASEVLSLPVKVAGDRVVTFGDVTTVRRTYKDPEGYARVNGQPALSLEVSKRIGENIIETNEKVRALVDRESAAWHAGVEVSYSQDQSRDVRDMLHDLQNNVLSAVILVMVVIVAALGARSAGLVGIAVPGSFLAGILMISVMGLTVNIVVLFSLIMAVGMLVDGAIVVCEFADRKMAEGQSRREAYAAAAKRMAWPITASTATTLAAFAPLLFWPGVVGEFMSYLPVTLTATLGASLLMALIFVPVLGSLVGRPGDSDTKRLARIAASETGDLHEIGGMTGIYLKVLARLIAYPWLVLGGSLLVLAGAYGAYGAWGRGVEFFPQVEPERAVLHVRARGDFSVDERDALVREVERQVLGMKEIGTVYARSGLQFRGQDLAEDVIGVIQLEFVDWRSRRPASRIIEELRVRTARVAGVIIEAREQEAGPPIGKPVQLELSARDPALLPGAVAKVRRRLEQSPDFIDVEDTRPVPGIEWQVRVDRSQAGRFGADVTLVGNAVQLVTNGIKVAEYRPNDADDEVDIVVRFPHGQRDLSRLERLRVPARDGLVPISNFVTLSPAPKIGTINRTDGTRVMSVKAGVVEGVLVDDKVRELQQWLGGGAGLDPGVGVEFKGEDEEQRESRGFLTKAFGVALFIMAIILVTQFDSYYQALLVLSAVVFSTVGVLLGLLLTGRPFGIVMTGVGVIALAGVVVNNNIVLIDTFNVLRRSGAPLQEAVLRTGAQRLRPVLLTTVTTVLGLLPMALGVNIDLFNRDIAIGAPSTQWWKQLATAVAGGLTFATVLTLILTPCLLMLGEKRKPAPTADAD